MEMSARKEGRGVAFASSPSVERYEGDEVESDLEAATTASISEGEGVEEDDEDEDGYDGEENGDNNNNDNNRGSAKPRRRKVDPARHTIYNMSARRAKVIPVTLGFENLFYSVRVREGKNPFHKKQKKTLLKDLHGELRPGEVTAIMGPSGAPPPLPSSSSVPFPAAGLSHFGRNGQSRVFSGKWRLALRKLIMLHTKHKPGAGKTTLLNLLAGRVQSSKIRGTVTVNDIPKDRIPRRTWARLSSYIMQVCPPPSTHRITLFVRF